ncbi:M23 family metallopeptidase [Bacillus fonticola]|uniref:M23 family metallopeptidase n=1 Tax=Bacillus fonticola TaxID=2728853 RepID=UPI001475C779|nr:M23 family metallopeptidase [Bacillus fonticola]
MKQPRTFVSKIGEPLRLIKVTAAATLLASTFTVTNPAFAKEDDNSELNTVYHVYLGDRWLGIVEDTSAIQAYIDQEISQTQEAYGQLGLDIESEIQYIPEQVFRKNTSPRNVLASVQSQLFVKAESYAIEIDGVPVTYVPTKEQAETVVKELKLTYASEEELAAVKEWKQTGEAYPELAPDETKTIDVLFDKNISIEKDKAAPEEILSPEEAIQYLQKGTLEEKPYTVKEGDVLGSIAAAHDLSIDELLQLNRDLQVDSLLQVGDELNVTVYEPFVNVQVKRAVFKNEKVPFKTTVVEDDTMYKGETKTRQEGKAGKRAVQYVIREQNGQRVGKYEVESEMLSEPQEKIIVKGTKVISSRGTGEWVWPTVGGYISSQMGLRWNAIHKGLDIARPSNYNIKAADNGVVEVAGYRDDGYGYRVIINHNNGYKTLYAHLASVSVRPGQTVPAGATIAQMGTTGDSTGVHLHFEVLQNGVNMNPLNYVSQ